MGLFKKPEYVVEMTCEAEFRGDGRWHAKVSFVPNFDLCKREGETVGNMSWPMLTKFWLEDKAVGDDRTQTIEWLETWGERFAEWCEFMDTKTPYTHIQKVVIQ